MHNINAQFKPYGRDYICTILGHVRNNEYKVSYPHNDGHIFYLIWNFDLPPKVEWLNLPIEDGGITRK